MLPIARKVAQHIIITELMPSATTKPPSAVTQPTAREASCLQWVDQNGNLEGFRGRVAPKTITAMSAAAVPWRAGPSNMTAKRSMVKPSTVAVPVRVWTSSQT